MSTTQRLNAAIPVVTTAELDADAHRTFRYWRKSHPLVAHEGGFFLVLRHDDVVKFSSDPRFQSTGTLLAQTRGIVRGPLFEIFERGMLTANHEHHRQKRTAVSRALAQQMMSELKTQVSLTAETLIDALYEQGQADLVSQFATQIPAQTFARLLDVPAEDVALVSSYVSQLMRFFSPSSAPDDIITCTIAAGWLSDYIARLLNRKRTRPDADFLSAYIHAAEEEKAFDVKDAACQIVQLILGGTASVCTSLVAQTSCLLLHREQWNSICERPTLIPAAVSEAMRYEPGIAGLVRVTSEDVEIGGSILPGGQLVVLSTLSAMRDENVFTNPDVFETQRVNSHHDHLAFGIGAHRCIAEAMARVELEVSLAVLTKRLPQLCLNDIPVFKGHVFVREPSACCVSWTIT